MERTIKDYATHLDDCNINKDWSEAFDAMADTPTQFRDFAFDQAYQELKTKSMTCTCGLEQLLASQPSEQKPPVDKAVTAPEDVFKGAEEFLIRTYGVTRDSLNATGAKENGPQHLFNKDQVVSFMQEFAQQSRQQAIQEFTTIVNKYWPADSSLSEQYKAMIKELEKAVKEVAP